MPPRAAARHCHLPGAFARRTPAVTPSSASPSDALCAMRPAAPERARIEDGNQARRRVLTERASGLPGQAFAQRAQGQWRLGCCVRLRGPGLCWGRASALCLRACQTYQANRRCGLAPLRARWPHNFSKARSHIQHHDTGSQSTRTAAQKIAENTECSGGPGAWDSGPLRAGLHFLLQPARGYHAACARKGRRSLNAPGLKLPVMRGGLLT